MTWSDEWQGNKFDDKGKVLEFEPERGLSFSHWSPGAIMLATVGWSARVGRGAAA